MENKKAKKIVIGSTGDYYADGLEPIYKIWIKNKYSDNTNTGQVISLTNMIRENIGNQIGGGASIVYQYDTETKNIFNSVKEIKANVGKSFQQIGASKKDLVSDLNNPKEEVTFIGMSNYFKRPVERLYYRNIDELQEENIFTELNVSNFRSISEKYSWKLSWDPKFDESEIRPITFEKTPNPNGLSEDWWEIQDWAKYYAMVAVLLDRKNIDDVVLEDYYPKENMRNYYRSQLNDFYPSMEEIQRDLGEEYSYDSALSDRTVKAFVIWIDDIAKKWGSHLIECGHRYSDFFSDGAIYMHSGFNDIPKTAKWYAYKPTFPGEIIQTDDGNNIVDLTVYAQNELFDDEESMLYSPFSLYVLEDDMFWINGKNVSIAGHLRWKPEDENEPEEGTHVSGHLFERYYIDRYINAHSAQEELEIYSNAWKKYISLDNNDEDKELIQEWLEENPMFVLDAWTGDIHKVGENWLYEPSIIYNNENIDLREIEKYSLDGLNPADTNIKIGNGVWADIYYQNVEKTYSFEDQAKRFKAWDAAKKYAKNNKNSMQALKEEKDTYELFLVELQELINAYTEKEV